MDYKEVAEMLKTELSSLKEEMNGRFDKIECNFVSRTEFAPYKAALNLAGIMFLTALVGSFIYLVAIHPGSLQAR